MSFDRSRCFNRALWCQIGVTYGAHMVLLGHRNGVSGLWVHACFGFSFKDDHYVPRSVSSTHIRFRSRGECPLRRLRPQHRDRAMNVSYGPAAAERRLNQVLAAVAFNRLLATAATVQVIGHDLTLAFDVDKASLLKFEEARQGVVGLLGHLNPTRFSMGFQS